MPIHFPPITRRRFLQTAAIGVSSAIGLGGSDPANSAPAAGVPVTAPPPAAPVSHRMVLLSDTHINADPAKLAGRPNVNLTDNLKQVLDEVARLDGPAGHLLINGDCAHIDGQAGDYEQLVKLIQPIREAGYDVHALLGNHDDREKFFTVGVQAQPDAPAVARRHVELIRMERANWLLLDSLWQVNITPGELGVDQLAWVEKLLDEHDDKPMHVVLHHSFDFDAEVKMGLRDTAALLDLLSPRKHVKSVHYGHTHNWSVRQRDDGLHVINLPPTAYVFRAEWPNGWVSCDLAEAGCKLTLSCLSKDHPQHGETHELVYR